MTGQHWNTAFEQIIFTIWAPSDVNITVDGSTHPAPAVEGLVLLDTDFFWVVKNAAGYHPGPVTPSTADEALIVECQCDSFNRKRMKWSMFSLFSFLFVSLTADKYLRLTTKDNKRFFYQRHERNGKLRHEKKGRHKKVLMSKDLIPKGWILLYKDYRCVKSLSVSVTSPE